MANFPIDSVHKEISVEIPGKELYLSNSDIWEESLNISSSLFEDDGIRFGVAATVLNVVLNAGEEIINEALNVYLTTEGITKMSLFKGYVDSVEKHSNRFFHKITAYDKLYEIIHADVSDWYNELTFPMTLKQFRDAFYSHFGVTQVSKTLPNDGMIVEKTIDPSELSGATVANAICELGGCFGIINTNGLLEYISLDSSTTNTISVVIGADFKDYSTKKVDKLQIRQEENDIGVTVGSGDNAYVVQDNFLCYGKGTEELTTVATALFNKIKNITYTPYNLEAPGNPTLKLGDKIWFSVGGKNVSSYIISRNLRGIQAMRDTYSAEGDYELPTKVNEVENKIIQLRGKTNSLSRSIEETKSQITDVQRGLQSEITQTAGQFDVKIQEIQKELDGEIKTYNVSYEPTLRNYPAWDFTYNIPCNNTVQLRDDLKLEYTDEYYSKNARTVAFNETDFTSYKFQKKDGVWQWVAVADSDYALLKKEIAEVKVTTNSITQEVSTLESTIDGDYYKKTETDAKIEVSKSGIMQTVSATYTTKDYVNGTFETVEHAESSYKQTADQIKLTVKKGSVISEINQTAEAVTIKASKIDLDGLVNMSQFTSKYATINALNATNLAVSGKLEASQFTADNISALGITVSSARVTGGFDASKITTGVLNADRINVNDLKARILTINNITSTLNAPDQGTITIGSVRTSNYQYYDGGTRQYRNLTMHRVRDVDGNMFYALGY